MGLAAQASIGAAALAAAELHTLRAATSQAQEVRVTRRAAELECTGFFELDGVVPSAWARLSGLYEAGDGYVRVHANFDHHRDGVLDLVGLPKGDRIDRDELARALQGWSAAAFEDEASRRGLVVAKVRSFEEWDRHPHALASRDLPLVGIRRMDDAPPRPLAPVSRTDRPLTGVRVLDLTRVLAGPICGRTLAAYGAEVLLVNSPALPNIAAIIDTSRGKRSAHVDLKRPEGRAALERLLPETRVFVQGYRPGGLADLGFGPEALAERHPGIICVSLSAYGARGPWSDRRGFDSLVQTATGFNHAEAHAAGSARPKPLPVQILDYASGFLMTFGAEAALLAQLQHGGSWHVEVSLLATAAWLRTLGRLGDGLATGPPRLREHLVEFPCVEGRLLGMPHAAEFSATPARWTLPSALPGEHPPAWSAGSSFP